jgi:hypothetical protein
MIFDELNALVDIYIGYRERKKADQKEKNFDLALLNLYKLGENGRFGISEEGLQDIQGISRTNLVLSIRDALAMGLLINISTYDGRGWILSNDDNLYVRALLADLKKRLIFSAID